MGDEVGLEMRCDGAFVFETSLVLSRFRKIKSGMREMDRGGGVRQ